jgi:hypothetical protein
MTVLAFTTSTGLRQRLAAAIRDRDAADAADAAEGYAKEALDQALLALQSSQREVDLLKRDIDAAHHDAVQASSAAIAQALKTGRPIPATTPLPGPDSPALTQAKARCEALEGAVEQLRKEHEQAGILAGQHCARVTELSDAIFLAEAEFLAADVIAAQERADELLDRLAGLCLRDQKRPGRPQLRELQARVVVKIDRPRREGIIERHAYNSFLDEQAARQEVAWKAYAARLAQSADAQFEPPSTDTAEGAAA